MLFTCQRNGNTRTILEDDVIYLRTTSYEEICTHVIYKSTYLEITSL